MWPDGYVYRNADTGRTYTAHHAAEAAWVQADTPAYAVALGGEGGGKSVAGIVKDLERIRRGCSGIMVSPDLPHFRRSLWPEFRRWCPWEYVVAGQRHRRSPEWAPTSPFEMVFMNGATIYCGGIDNPTSWEGPNVNWAHMDEARKSPDAGPLKVLSGRVRIPGPQGEPPQLWITTTPEMNWLYDYFGPPRDDDDFAAFKANSRIVQLRTQDNAANLAPGYVEQRGQTLTEAEKRVYLGGEWENIDTGQRFLPSMLWWDACKETLPALGTREPLVLAMDASVSGDSWGLVGVTRHGAPGRHDHIAVRYAREWVAPGHGRQIIYETDAKDGPIDEVRRLCAAYSVIALVYDPYQLVSVSQRLAAEGLAWLLEFPQGAQRLEADRALLDAIVQRKIAHGGEAALRAHVDNADRKLDTDGRRLRIVKRSDNKKVDLCVCLSMAAYQCGQLNL